MPPGCHRSATVCERGLRGCREGGRQNAEHMRNRKCRRVFAVFNGIPPTLCRTVLQAAPYPHRSLPLVPSLANEGTTGRLRGGYGGATEVSACGPGEQGIPPGTANGRTSPRKRLRIRELRGLLGRTSRRVDTQPSQVRLPSFTRRSTGSDVSRVRARSTSNSATQSLCSSGSTSICCTRQVFLSSDGRT